VVGEPLTADLERALGPYAPGSRMLYSTGT